MTRLASNFDFLDADFPELFRAGLTIERLLEIDADACCAKLRYFAEVWLLYWAHGHKVSLNNHQGLHGMISHAKQRGLLNCIEVNAYLHELRVMGNTGAHVTINSITGDISRTYVTRGKLREGIRMALSLADILMRKFVKQASHAVRPWVAPVGYHDTEHAYLALHDDADAVYDIAQRHLMQLENLPVTHCREGLPQINNTIEDCVYWCKKCLRVGHHKGYLLLMRLYSGEIHPQAKDDSLLRHYRKLALQQDDTGDVQVLVAHHYQKRGAYARATEHFLEAHRLGHKDGLSHALEVMFAHDKNHFDALLASEVTKDTPIALLYQLASDALSSATHSDTKRFIILLRATSTPGASFVDALVTLRHAGDARTNDGALTTLLGHWKKMPTYSCAAALTVLWHCHYERFSCLNDEVVHAALAQAPWLDNSNRGLLYYAIGRYDVDCAMNDRFRDIAFYYQPMMNRAKALHCEQALAWQTTMDDYKRSLIGRRHKEDREQLKMRRKQARMNRKKKRK